MLEIEQFSPLVYLQWTDRKSETWKNSIVNNNTHVFIRVVSDIQNDLWNRSFELAEDVHTACCFAPSLTITRRWRKTWRPSTPCCHKSCRPGAATTKMAPPWSSPPRCLRGRTPRTVTWCCRERLSVSFKLRKFLTLTCQVGPLWCCALDLRVKTGQQSDVLEIFSSFLIGGLVIMMLHRDWIDCFYIIYRN